MILELVMLGFIVMTADSAAARVLVERTNCITKQVYLVPESRSHLECIRNARALQCTDGAWYCGNKFPFGNRRRPDAPEQGELRLIIGPGRWTSPDQ